ncbi:N4-gp56 family major capsid protein [Alkalihalobacterium chitinilyticum]|uniref:N4-gp56 family major capsid protein n=1 Tax=Alkalihalobacterium chitinilyticum TaxID=2980103 RepID=A0ABT5VJ65_9BACI|nr:N4-gp56 family major capsid protein [Alkalihalobacterium chitinilyticum]MDE5415490.1 N4-gp56 family major capsid protein [Alkalihalobacterium chitinilyticum]
MSVTKIQDLINPEVMADMIAAELPAAIRFAPLANLDDTLVGQPGNTITVPAYKYIGDAEVVAEGEAIDLTKMETETDEAKIVKFGKAVELTDESVLSGYGDPVGNAKDQIKKSIAAGVDNSCLAALKGATLFVGDGTEAISESLILDATDKFNDEEEEAKLIFIAPSQAREVRADENFLSPRVMVDYGIQPLMPGVIGMLGECQVMVSRKIEAVAGKFENIIVKTGALTIYLKKSVELETDRDILAKTTAISADQHCIAHLSDDSKVIRVVSKA